MSSSNDHFITQSIVVLNWKKKRFYAYYFINAKEVFSINTDKVIIIDFHQLYIEKKEVEQSDDKRCTRLQ